MRLATRGVASDAPVRALARLAGVFLALAGVVGACPAGAQNIASAELPLEVAPCLVWGDALPVELTRGHAREAILCLVNQERAAAGLSPVEQDRRLERASQRHTETMNRTGCFTHKCPGEAGLERRLSRYLAGHLRRYRYCEVTAWGTTTFATPRLIVDRLMNSPLHRAKILSPIFEAAGVGFVVGTHESGLPLGGIYTIDFGMRTG